MSSSSDDGSGCFVIIVILAVFFFMGKGCAEMEAKKPPIECVIEQPGPAIVRGY